MYGVRAFDECAVRLAVANDAARSAVQSCSLPRLHVLVAGLRERIWKSHPDQFCVGHMDVAVPATHLRLRFMRTSTLLEGVREHRLKAMDKGSTPLPHTAVAFFDVRYRSLRYRRRLP